MLEELLGDLLEAIFGTLPGAVLLVVLVIILICVIIYFVANSPKDPEGSAAVVQACTAQLRELVGCR